MSLVDGYNLPVRIDNNKGCAVPECAVDLGPNCPAPLKGPYDSTGFPVGCKSACEANLDGNQGMLALSSGTHHWYLTVPSLCSELAELLQRPVRHRGDLPALWRRILLLLQGQLPRLLRLCLRYALMNLFNATGA